MKSGGGGGGDDNIILTHMSPQRMPCTAVCLPLEMALRRKPLALNQRKDEGSNANMGPKWSEAAVVLRGMW